MSYIHPSHQHTDRHSGIFISRKIYHWAGAGNGLLACCGSYYGCWCLKSLITGSLIIPRLVMLKGSSGIVLSQPIKPSTLFRGLGNTSGGGHTMDNYDTRTCHGYRWAPSVYPANQPMRQACWMGMMEVCVCVCVCV